MSFFKMIFFTLSKGSHFVTSPEILRFKWLLIVFSENWTVLGKVKETRWIFVLSTELPEADCSPPHTWLKSTHRGDSAKIQTVLFLNCWRRRERESVLPVWYSHATIFSPLFLHSIGIWSMHIICPPSLSSCRGQDLNYSWPYGIWLPNH